jgi:hypothetical protein
VAAPASAWWWRGCGLGAKPTDFGDLFCWLGAFESLAIWGSVGATSASTARGSLGSLRLVVMGCQRKSNRFSPNQLGFSARKYLPRS